MWCCEVVWGEGWRRQRLWQWTRGGGRGGGGGAGVAVGVDRGGRRRGIAGGRGGVFVVRPSTHACQPGNEQALVGSPVAALIKPSPTSTS